MRSVRTRLDHVCVVADQHYSQLSKDEMNALYFACLRDLLNEGNSASMEELMRKRGAPEHVIRHYIDVVFAGLITSIKRVYPPDESPESITMEQARA